MSIIIDTRDVTGKNCEDSRARARGRAMLYFDDLDVEVLRCFHLPHIVVGADDEYVTGLQMSEVPLVCGVSAPESPDYHLVVDLETIILLNLVQRRLPHDL